MCETTRAADQEGKIRAECKAGRRDLIDHRALCARRHERRTGEWIYENRVKPDPLLVSGLEYETRECLVYQCVFENEATKII